MILLKISGLSKSTFYYTLSKNDKDDKNKEIIEKIKEIFFYHKERYGYRRITLELKNQGYNVNHKKVYRLMVKLGLKPLKRNKRKYSSYKGTVGKISDNLIKRDFYAKKPNQKWYTDVTEFNLRGEKCYLSPILDGYNGEVISYYTAKSPNLEQNNDMLNKAFKNKNLEGLIMHSDQGWQYQHQSYQQRLNSVYIFLLGLSALKSRSIKLSAILPTVPLYDEYFLLFIFNGFKPNLTIIL